MHAVRVIEDASHPDTPAQVPEGTIARPLWAVYIEGAIFLRTPVREDARHAADVALASGRYEYVDIRTEEDRRAEHDRREHQDNRPRGLAGLRGADRRQS